MSLSDRFKSMLQKNSEPSSFNKEKASEPSAPPPVPPAPAPPSKTLEELDRLIAQERIEGDAKQQVVDRELVDIRTNLEKLELESKSSRETHNQSLQFLQQDAAREIKFFERKLHEDMTLWDQQLKEREKTIEAAICQAESGHQEKKDSYKEASAAGADAAVRAEALLKGQEGKLLEERQKWHDLLQSKEHELLALKQGLARREADLESEFKKQESQRQSTQELWQSRLKELEHQWAEKRGSWEAAMKAKEEERVRLHATFQEKQASWQLEQECQIQDMARRQERAQEKLAALKAHALKEMQNWQHLAQTREEQVQQLKVKLLLSETEAKGHLDQTQKVFQNSVSQITGRIQTLQKALHEEQEDWQKQFDAKEQEVRAIKEEMQAKLGKLKSDFQQRLAVITAEKETLNAELQDFQTGYEEAKAQYDTQTESLRDQQGSVESAHAQRLVEIKKHGDEETSALQVQITAFERQKEESQRDLEALRLRWQEQLVAKDQALREAQGAIGPQETELRKRYALEEETVTRAVEAFKARQRALERDMARARELVEKAVKDQTAVIQALEIDHRNKEESLRQRTTEQTARLRQRLQERRLALEAFMAMKKDEEARVQAALQAKEKERAELDALMQTLPQELEKALQEKKTAAQKDSEAARGRISALEAELAQAREESKAIIQTKATQLATLRQALEQKSKEVSAALRTEEQILESERAQVEKQMSSNQADMDRVRAHWQDEIDKKEKEIQALQDELRKQEVLQRQTLETEQKRFEEQFKPLALEHRTLAETLEHQRAEHEAALQALEKQTLDGAAQIQQTIDQERVDKTSCETRFREERARWKARLSALESEREGVRLSGQGAFEEKSRQIEELEEQIRAQAVSHETRRRDIIHQATQKARTLQEIIHQIEHELKTTQDLLPQEIKEREEAIAKLQVTLAAAQESHQKTVSRFDRASKTLERRASQKEERLRQILQAVREEWAKKTADREAEITALQSNLLARESERQGELDRLAKQFAEERFQLEKSKDELEWTLKDRKEVAERQINSRQKELQAIEAEIRTAQVRRDQEIGQKRTAYETEKTKLQAALSSFEKQIEETRHTQEASLTSKGDELQTILSRSKEHLRVLGEEFTQKVALWRSTNDSLHTQVEQLKGHVAQAQESWDVLRKEKENEIGKLRQDLGQWEARIKSETEEFDRTFSREREALVAQVRKQETVLQETLADFGRRLNLQEEEMLRATDEIHSHEAGTGAQWHASLEQWETEKQSLQAQQSHLEQEIVAMQNRFQAELHQAEETSAKLRMDIAFKETQAATQSERLQSQMVRELAPLRERLVRLAAAEESERNAWEARLRAKDDELKLLKTRLAQRDKRLQDEGRRRTQELDKLRRQVTEETEATRARYEDERAKLESLLMERREALGRLLAREKELLASEHQAHGEAAQALVRERQALEGQVNRVASQREHLRDHYESLLKDREIEEGPLTLALDSKDQELEALRDNAKELAVSLRKKMETLRQSTRLAKLTRGPTSAAAWSAFEMGVGHYQTQQWPEALAAFEDCLQKDPRWGAAYQYLALTYHAQGNTAMAAQTAARARELDPTNTQLATWVDRLQTSIQPRPPIEVLNSRGSPDHRTIEETGQQKEAS